jgi:hypothetical protein
MHTSGLQPCQDGAMPSKLLLGSRFWGFNDLKPMQLLPWHFWRLQAAF